MAAVACSAPEPGAENGGATAIGAQAALPTFERVLQLETTSDTSANVSIGDLNGDGYLDLRSASSPE
jgi:hypothetical protein